MKRKILLLSSLFFLLVLLFLAFSSDKPQDYTEPAAPKPLSEKQVLTYFYYWYDLPDGVHSTSLTDYPADEKTSYKRIGWFEQQLSDMNEAGIDTALAVYWSDKEESSKAGLKNLVQARANLMAQGKQVPKIALFLDTGIFGQLPSRERNLSNEKGRKQFYGYIKEFYQQVPQENWGLVEGRPIIWLWANYFGIRFDQKTFDYVYQNFEKDFGIRPYIVREASWNFPQSAGFFKNRIDYSNPLVTDNFYSWGAALNGYQDVGGVASVGPGYDERELKSPDRQGRFAERNGGAWYKENLEKALNSGKSLIVIETWNEFHEASDVAESEEYGREYIEISKNFLPNF